MTKEELIKIKLKRVAAFIQIVELYFPDLL